MKRMVMVGTEKGAFLLWGNAAGESWSVEGPVLKGWKAFDVVADRRRAPVLYAAVGSWVYGPMVQISRDLGKTWEQVERGPAYGEGAPGKLKNIWTVVPGPLSEPETLYAGVEEAGLFVSRDGGIHWNEIPGVANHPSRAEWVPGAGGLCCHSIAVHPTNTRRMWVGISAVGVLRTDDGGDTWQVKNEGLEIVIPAENNKDIGSCVHRLVLDTHNPERLYQQNHRGVFRTENGGDTWERVENGLEGTFGFPMALHPHDPNTLFIVPEESDQYRMPKGGQLAVFRTQNRGDDWQKLEAGLPAECYSGVMRQALAMDDTEAGGVYFGTTGGEVFASVDNGEQWRKLPCTLPRVLSVNALCVD